jgi:hypothetical protein
MHTRTGAKTIKRTTEQQVTLAIEEQLGLRSLAIRDDITQLEKIYWTSVQITSVTEATAFLNGVQKLSRKNECSC